MHRSGCVRHPSQRNVNKSRKPLSPCVLSRRSRHCKSITDVWTQQNEINLNWILLLNSRPSGAFFSQHRITIVIKLQFKHDFILSRHIKLLTEQRLISISLSFQISWSRASGYRQTARSPPRTRISTSAGTARISARRKLRDLRLRTSSAPARPRPHVTTQNWTHHSFGS